MESSPGLTNEPYEIPGEGELIRDAHAFATDRHRGQKRKADGSAFIGHLARVSQTVAEAGCDEHSVAAALLHDAIEKAEVGEAEIRQRFGDAVADLVVALTDDPGIEGYAERKRALREQTRAAGRRAAVVYAADKLDNVRDIRAVWESTPEVVPDRIGVGVPERVALWREDVEMVREQAAGAAIVDQLDRAVAEFEGALEAPGE